MQYRYKVGNSYEARKSSTNTPSQSHKNDSLTYINLLDKCTRMPSIMQKSSERTVFGFATNSKPTMKKYSRYSNKPKGQSVLIP